MTPSVIDEAYDWAGEVIKCNIASLLLLLLLLLMERYHRHTRQMSIVYRHQCSSSTDIGL